MKKRMAFGFPGFLALPVVFGFMVLACYSPDFGFGDIINNENVVISPREARLEIEPIEGGDGYSVDTATLTVTIPIATNVPVRINWYISDSNVVDFVTFPTPASIPAGQRKSQVRIVAIGPGLAHVTVTVDGKELGPVEVTVAMTSP